MPDTLYHWSDPSLAGLPVKNGFRLRGMEMTRLETFTDAAFAFAVTLLVISVDDIPGSYEEFIAALTQIPAFIACFMQLILFWWGHHNWSRRYGLEDGASMLCSLALVATVLIYIYPLRVIIGAFFANATGDFLPSPFALNMDQIGNLFVVFGAGFTALCGMLMGLYLIALNRRKQLAMNPLEEFLTKGDASAWGLAAITGLISMLLAILLPDEVSPAAGYVYWSLAITMPLLSYWIEKRTEQLIDSKADG